MKRRGPFPVRRRTGRALAATLTLLLVAAGCRRQAAAAPQAAAPVPSRAAPASAAAGRYGFRPAEKAAIDEFLGQNTPLRVATDEDQRPAENGDDVGALYGVYHPYFVRGDANDDGVLDFVLAFVKRDASPDAPWFSVVLFLGRSDGGFSPGTFLERDTSLADGDLSLDRDTIVVTPDTAEDAARRYRWDAGKQRHEVVRDAPEDDLPSPPPAQT